MLTQCSSRKSQIIETVGIMVWLAGAGCGALLPLSIRPNEQVSCWQRGEVPGRHFRTDESPAARRTNRERWERQRALHRLIGSTEAESDCASRVRKLH